jgi:hypothetical protein
MPSPRAGYLDVAALAILVRAHRRKKIVSEDLGRALQTIAGGVWDRYRFTADRDDFIQDVVVHLMGRPLANCDPKKHLFNYFTTCAIRYGLKLRDKAAGERRRFEAYAQQMADEGRLPEDDRTARWEIAREIGRREYGD